MPVEIAMQIHATMTSTRHTIGTLSAISTYAAVALSSSSENHAHGADRSKRRTRAAAVSFLPVVAVI
jgi:hypothetical protein